MGVGGWGLGIRDPSTRDAGLRALPSTMLREPRAWAEGLRAGSGYGIRGSGKIVMPVKTGIQGVPGFPPSTVV